MRTPLTPVRSVTTPPTAETLEGSGPPLGEVVVKELAKRAGAENKVRARAVRRMGRFMRGPSFRVWCGHWADGALESEFWARHRAVVDGWRCQTRVGSGGTLSEESCTLLSENGGEKPSWEEVRR